MNRRQRTVFARSRAKQTQSELQEGLNANGTLKKGYRYEKGGKIVKVGA